MGGVVTSLDSGQATAVVGDGVLAMQAEFLAEDTSNAVVRGVTLKDEGETEVRAVEDLVVDEE